MWYPLANEMRNKFSLAWQAIPIMKKSFKEAFIWWCFCVQSKAPTPCHIYKFTLVMPWDVSHWGYVLYVLLWYSQYTDCVWEVAVIKV